MAKAKEIEALEAARDEALEAEAAAWGDWPMADYNGARAVGFAEALEILER